MPLFKILERFNSQDEINNIKYVNNLFTNINHKYILYLTCNWYPSHSHIMQDLVWQFSFFFELKQTYSNLILLLDSNNIPEKSEVNKTNGLAVNSIVSMLNILNIPHYLGQVQISKTNKEGLYLCNKLFHIPILRHSQHDIDDNDMSNFDEKAFIYKNMCLYNNPVKYQMNFKIKNNTNGRLNYIMDLFLINMEKLSTITDIKYDNIYFSRRLDTNKFYHMENINSISDLINKHYKTKEFTKLWNLSTKDKINYLFNCKRFIVELSTAAIYAFFCKKDTEIIIIASDNNIIQYAGILRSIKKRFKNFILIKGYDICMNYKYNNFYNINTPANYQLNGCITCPILFNFEIKDKNSIFLSNYFKYFGKKKICLRSIDQNKQLKFNWPAGELGHLGYTIEVNNNIKNNIFEYKEVDVYEFIGSSLYKDLNSENIESKIARNNINRRFLMTNREFDEIISYFKKLNIPIIIIPCDIWHGLRYIVKPEQIAI